MRSRADGGGAGDAEGAEGPATPVARTDALAGTLGARTTCHWVTRKRIR
jgi:hypothetical protein